MIELDAGAYVAWAVDAEGGRITEYLPMQIAAGSKPLGPLVLGPRQEDPFRIAWHAAGPTFEIAVHGRTKLGPSEALVSPIVDSPSGQVWANVAGLQHLDLVVSVGGRHWLRRRVSLESGEREAYLDLSRARPARIHVTINGRRPKGAGSIGLMPVSSDESDRSVVVVPSMDGEVDLVLPDRAATYLYSYVDDSHPAFVCGLLEPALCGDGTSCDLFCHWQGEVWSVDDLLPTSSDRCVLEGVGGMGLETLIPSARRTWSRSSFPADVGSEVFLDRVGQEWRLFKEEEKQP
jgi:hypothetical protein